MIFRPVSTVILTTALVATITAPLPALAGADRAAADTTDLRAAPAALPADPNSRVTDDVDLPISRAVLYASGVGYFEHIGTVDGDATVRLLFKADQINDVLKSMVLMDEDGGTITRVTYPSNDPIDRALQSFAIDLSGNPSLPELLRQLRGAEVILHAPDRIQGRILNIDERVTVKDNTRTVEYLINLVTATGIRSIPLTTVQNLELADPKLRDELNSAMALLSGSRDTERKPVDIRFEGEGQRRVRIGYIVETPVWKTSYRLDLSDANEKPLLQGWSIVENTSDNDWQRVRLSLVSGRPISFIQDLYTPLYLERPVVVPELYASLRPRMYEEGMAERRMQAMDDRDGRAPGAPAPSARARSGGVGGGQVMADAMMEAEVLRMELGRSIEASASGGQVGELFQFTIRNPVDIDRRRSAMLPIINQGITAERVSIYNRQQLDTNPLNGVYVTNDSEMTLLAGPVTVYDDGAYAGDAQLGNLSPGEKRFLSYAIDLNVAVNSSTTSSDRITTGSISRGVMHITRVNRFEQKYELNNKGERARSVIIEHPLVQGRELVQPTEYLERTPTHYRFRVEVAANEQVEFTVIEQQRIGQTIQLIDQPVNTLAWYISNSQVPAAVRQALERVVAARNALADLQNELNRITRQMQEMVQGQQRLRENIATVGAESTLGRRYLARLSEEEDQLDAWRQETARLRERIITHERELAEMIRGLNIGN